MGPWASMMTKLRGDRQRDDASDLRIRAQHLNRILARERNRADRSGQALSMVLLGYDGKNRRRRDASPIVRLMQQRARITDEIGWFDRVTGFAVLPDTPASGGKRFAELVLSKLRERGILASYAIYQYVPPTRRDEDDADPPARGPRLADHEPVAELAGAAGGAGSLDAVAMSVGGEGGVMAGAKVHALERLMARRLPWWKRATDLGVAGGALLLLWPAMVGVGLAIRLDSPGPVIFKQRRAGLGGQPFDIWKFRTMHRDAEGQRDRLLSVNEQDGPAFKLRDDPRVTRVGAVLRKTSLDELPQLINILRGQMTLVGPRPLPMIESDGCSPWQRRRLDVTPGLTCIWQVWGRSTVSFNEWVRMDLRYQRKSTPRYDLKILLATVPAVLRQRGAC